MIRNYLIIAFRHIVRGFGFSMLNILGLAVGIACCLLITLYVQFELRYDSLHENQDHLYRYIPRSEREGELAAQVYTPAGLAPFIKENFHEIDYVARYSDIDANPLFKWNDEVLRPGLFSIADSSFFKMFSFNLLHGAPENVLNRPMTIVISQRLAKDYFPGENPVGKTIRYNDKLDFEIAGVFEDIPVNSTYQFEYLASFISLPEIQKLWGGSREDALTQMDAWNYETYLMTSYSRMDDLQRRIDEKVYVRTQGKPVPENHVQDWLQPIREIHFTHGIKGDVGGTGNMQHIYIFSSVAAFVLLIAAFNFINLSIARGVKRTKEVAMRKTMGASRQQIVRQFLGETALFVVIAFVIAFQLLELGLPLFNTFMDMKLFFSLGDNVELVAIIFGLGIVTAITAGGYPAFYLSSFEPVRALKLDKISSGKSTLRKAIIAVQFGIASFMIIATVLVYLQMRFMKKVNLGFEKENVVSFVPTIDIRLDFDQFKERLLQIDGVLGVTISNGVPGQTYGHWLYKIPDSFGDKSVAINTAAIDYDYLDVLGIELKEGRKLSPEHSTDAELSYLINEAAAKKFLLDNPVGTEIQVLDNAHDPGTIVGVVKDFHWRSLHHPVEPLVLRIDPNNSWQVSVKLDAAKTPGALALIKKEWDRKSSEHPFDFTFLDKNLDRLYKSEEKTGILMTSFSSLAIVIACLGLLGLSAFMIEQRKKEVGIRKVMGADVYHIVSLLSWDFLRLVLIGFIMIIPLTWYAVDKWLQNFAYRISIDPLVFIGSGLLVILTAFVTVGTLSYRASIVNPGETLKYE